MAMRIAVIGAGNVGGVLGRRWAELGHAVTFGVRPGSQVKGGPAGARTAPVPDAVRDAEVVVLAVPWAAVPDALASAGPLDGKVLVDTTNPVARGAGGTLVVDEGHGHRSAAERVRALAPGARVVKAFNTTGFDNMADPVYAGEASVMFYAGDDAAAKRDVRALVAALGFDPVDAGPLVRARELEHLALLWISLAMSGMGRQFAFRLLKR